MKKISTSIGMLAIALAVSAPFASARDISKNDALRTAKDFVKSRPLTRSLSNAVEFAYAEPSATTDADCFYVFNIGTEGFVIVAGDSDARQVLGYSDNGNFDPKNVPANVRWWLDQYREEIDALRGHAVAPTRASSEYHYVAPLIDTQWDQTAPYNDLCPKLPNDNGVYTNAYTGCVATAMAQIMNYHKWPKGAGRGEHTDFFESSASYDFSTMDIDWDALKTTPKVFTASPEAARTAVANLMLAVGVSMDMQYKSKSAGSGAWTLCAPNAFVNNFGYSTAIDYLQRNAYNDDEWHAVLYSELQAGRPVMYAGASESSGHAFVCDGYEDGLFHFNWGWSGSYDGFFATNAMYPAGGGSGAGDYEKGYNKNQEIVIGIQPPVVDEEAAVHSFIEGGSIDYTGNKVVNDVTRAAFAPGTSGRVKNYWPYQMNILFAFGIWDETGTELLGYTGNSDINKIGWNTSYIAFPYGYSIFYNDQNQGPFWNQSISEITTQMPTLSDGKYYMRPMSWIYSTKDEENTPVNHKYHIMRTTDRSQYTQDLILTVSNGSYSYTPAAQPESGCVLPMGMDIDRKVASIKPEETLQLNAILFPALDNVALSWVSADKDIATVDNNGVVTGVAEGKTQIWVSTKDGSTLEAVCELTVSKDSGVEGTEADNSIIVQGADDTITIEGAPEGSLIEVYNVAGLRVASAKAKAGTNVIRLGEGRGIYVVRVGAYQSKVRL